MNHSRAGWAVGGAFLALLGCTEALYVGNEPDQASAREGTGGATTTTVTKPTGGAAGATATGGTGGATTTTVTKPTGGAAGATATAIVGGASPSSTATCFDDVPITPEQRDWMASAACNAWSVEPEMLPHTLGLVVNASIGMAEPVEGSSATNWDIVGNALVDVLLGSADNVGMPPSASVGLLAYPNQANNPATATTPTDVNACLNVSAMTPAQQLGGDDEGSHRSLLRQRLGEVVLGLGAATHDAYDYALRDMLLAAEPLTVPVERSLLLVTDGATTYYKGCYNPTGQLQELLGDPILGSVQYAQSLGIKTFVIGLPGSEDARPWLSQAAYFGGTARENCAPRDPNGPYCHDDLAQAADLNAAFRATLEEQILPTGQCRFALPTQTPDGTSAIDLSRMVPIMAFADGSARRLYNNTSAPVNCSTGFRWVDSGILEINRNACEQLFGAGATLQVTFGCTPEELTGEIQ